jgi:hypothetical protein
MCFLKNTINRQGIAYGACLSIEMSQFFEHSPVSNSFRLLTFFHCIVCKLRGPWQGSSSATPFQFARDWNCGCVVMSQSSLPQDACGIPHSLSHRFILAARPMLPQPPRQEALLPLCVTGISTGRMLAICTLATPLCRPASRHTGTSAGPSCGTFVPSVPSRRHALWLSPGDRFLLVPTGN